MLYSKNFFLETLIYSFFTDTRIKYSRVSSNKFVSLKSPFHYKLPKIHLDVKSIDIDVYHLSTLPNLYGKLYKVNSIKHKNYNL